MATTSKTGSSSSAGFSAQEKAAMKEHAAELRAAKAREKQADKAAADEKDVLAKIAEMPADDRVMAETIHAIVKEEAPGLQSRTWYGMPAYTSEGKVVCFFKARSKFDGRYAQLGFEDNAALDDGAMWSVVFALDKIGEAEEKRIRALVRQAAG